MNNDVTNYADATAMQIESGESTTPVALKDEVIFKFDKGLPAFEKSRDFIFILDEKVAPFVVMQAVDDASLSFVCVDPFSIKDNFEIKIPEGVEERMDIRDVSEIMILSFVTVSPEVTETTANLLGPIVLNMRNNKASQVIQDHLDPSLVRYNIWKGLEAMDKDNTLSQMNVS